MAYFVRHYCGTCDSQLRYGTKDYEHADGTKTCRWVRPIRAERQ